MIATTFDIRDHIDKFTPVKGKGKDRYLCPACEKDNFTIDHKTGEYQCWDGCECKAIRAAIAPLPVKTLAPKSEQSWDYFDKDGQPLIRVCRTDDGNGSKRIWQQYWHKGAWRKADAIPSEVKNAAKASVMPYRYSEAIKYQQIFWVEGEKCADALWLMGIAAVTSIGGCDGFGRYGSYGNLFKDKDLVASPDMDQPGMKYCEAIASLYPDVKWLYPFPTDYRWTKLPTKSGVDIYDWIKDGVSKDGILTAVEERRVEMVKAEPKAAPLLSTAKISMIEMGDRIRDLLAQNLRPDELEAAKIELRSVGVASEREFERLWQSVTNQVESQSEGIAEVNSGIDLLLSVKESGLELSSVLPSSLAKPLEQIATWQSLKPELYLMSLLATTGSLAKNGTKLVLQRAIDFEVTPNIFVAIVAESSQKKSPVLKTMAKKPLRKITNWAKEDYQLALNQWNAEKKAAEDNKEPFTTPEPVQRVYFFTKASGESILRQAARVPDQGLLNLSDELAGYFKSSNQYRGGRGGDAEDLLEYYDGSGGTVLRVEGVQADVETLNYGLLGTIQPKVLQKFLGDCDDANGGWARFFFVQQPTIASTLPDEDLSFDISDLLTGIYGKINQFPAAEYRLDTRAFRVFKRCYDELEQQRVNEANPALRAVYGKTAGRIGKIALNLHLIDAAVANLQPDQLVSEATIRRAIAISKLAIDQIKALYCEFGGDELTGNLAKVVELSRRKGELKARDVQRSFDKANCPSPATVRQWFAQLTEQSYGTLNGSGTGLTFTAYENKKPQLDTEMPIQVDEVAHESQVEAEKPSVHADPEPNVRTQENRPTELIKAGDRVWYDRQLWQVDRVRDDGTLDLQHGALLKATSAHPNEVSRRSHIAEGVV